MRSRDRNLIDQIERDVSQEDVPVAAALRKVILLGGRVGSTELRDWASRELKGYVGIDDDDVPDYRIVPAVIALDGSNMRFRITGQQISRFDLPDVAREHIQESFTFRQGVGELEAALRHARTEGSVKLQLMGSAELAKIMNHCAQQNGIHFQSVERVYHQVSEPNLAGVVDGIRTTLAALVGEMRAGMPDIADEPSAAVADQAVGVAVYGNENRVQIAHASNGKVKAGQTETRGGRTTVWAVLGTLVAIVGVAITAAAWQGWGM